MAEKSAEATPSTATTPSSQEEKSGGNWWDSWISSAKTKSAEVYSMVKKDLDEIGTAVKCEASHVFSTTSTVIGKTLKLDEPESPANVMKKSLSSFIGQVSTVLNPELDDEDDTEVILSSGDTTMLSTYKKELEGLQRVDATFMVPVCGPEYEAWRATREEEGKYVGGARRRMDASPVLRAQFEKLVPDAVSEEDFWERYMFRVALLQDRLAAASRKQAHVDLTADPVLAHIQLESEQPVQQSPKKVLSGIEETPSETEDVACTVAWEDEDFAHDVELTEEQQILLLEEYEREIASKKLSKQTSSRDLANNNSDHKSTSTEQIKRPVTNTQIAQTRDKMNNKPTQISNQKVAANKTVATKKITTAQKKQANVTEKKTSTDNSKKTTDKKASPKKAPAQTVRSPKKTKADECGNNIVEDYFGDNAKDDASANSDESWEKEFEIEDVDVKS